jgi:hypothetical protein
MGGDPSMNRSYLGFLSVASAFARDAACARFKRSQELEQMLLGLQYVVAFAGCRLKWPGRR